MEDELTFEQCFEAEENDFEQMTDGDYSLEMRNYSYRPLETATTIRLLFLQPPSDGVTEALLEGKLLHVDLDNFENAVIEFLQGCLPDGRLECGSAQGFGSCEAISYVWGTLEYACMLYSDDGPIPITPNLDEVLRRVRLKDRIRVLWVDGVCINQNNVMERGHQVKQMGKIYQTASCVLIWLGADPAQRDWMTDHDINRLVSQTAHSTSMQILYSGCEWFERMWVVQEAYLAKTAVAMWGIREVDFQEITTAALDFRHSLIYKISWIRYIFSNDGQDLDFLDLLNHTRFLKCTDDRDRVYALLGLPYKDRTIIDGIEPDYILPLQELYFHVACSAINSGRAVDLFRLVLHPAQLPLRTDAPSWVPNWSDSFHLSFPNAPKSSKDSFVAASLDSSAQAVTVRGVRIGKIAHLSGSLQTKGVGLNKQAILSFWEQFIVPIPSDPTTPPNLSFCEVVMCGEMWEKALPRDKRLVESARSFENLDFIDNAYHMFAEDEAPDFVWMRSSIQVDLAHAMDLSRAAERQDVSFDFAQILKGRKLFTTRNYFIGLGPQTMREGDILALFSRGGTPFVLRPQGGYYQLVGAAYVSGLMYGEGLHIWQMFQDELQNFQIR